MKTINHPELGHIRVVRVLNKEDFPFQIETEKNIVFHDTLMKMSFDKKMFGFKTFPFQLRMIVYILCTSNSKAIE